MTADRSAESGELAYHQDYDCWLREREVADGYVQTEVVIEVGGETVVLPPERAREFGTMVHDRGVVATYEETDTITE